jgi:transposase
MNQIMINAAEWLAMQDRLDTLKRENEQLKKSLSDANARIKILIEEVGFAERGYTKSNVQI